MVSKVVSNCQEEPIRYDTLEISPEKQVEALEDEDNNTTSAATSPSCSVFCSLPLNKEVRDLLDNLDTPPKPPQPSSSLLSNKKPRKFLCLYCERTFATGSLRSKHEERCHSAKQARRSSSRFQQSPLKPTVCFLCPQNSDALSLCPDDLFKHLLDAHSDTYFGCYECRERYSSLTHLQSHREASHSSHVDSTISNDLSPSSPPNGTTDDFTLNIDREADVEEDDEPDEPNRVQLRKRPTRRRKIAFRSAKLGVKRNTRLQAKQTLQALKKRNVKALASDTSTTTTPEKNGGGSSGNSVTSDNPYPAFDAYYRVKKITDHSIDNLRISSLTFDDVFDKAFYSRIKCNIRENLLHHIDGKLFKNKESDARISNFEKGNNRLQTNTQPPQQQNQQQVSTSSTTENYGCELSLNAATPSTSLSTTHQLQTGEDILESQIEYGSKASNGKKKSQSSGQEEVRFKYLTRRKYQASILESKENRDLSRLDMWTQLVVKNRQQRIVDDNKSDKERTEYKNGDEYKAKKQNEELNRVLDKRGPFEDLKEEANKQAALEGNLSQEAYVHVTSLMEDIFSKIFDDDGSAIDVDIKAPIFTISVVQQVPDLPAYLNLQRGSPSVPTYIDKSDKISLICSSQDIEGYNEHEPSLTDPNKLVELTGEWARSRLYICAVCGLKVSNMKLLMEHKSVVHANVWCQHYEFVGNQGELYRHLSIPALGKMGELETLPTRAMWRRSEARRCSKCKKQCNSLGELHRHVLECGEDWAWMMARKKCKYRPFGAKTRKKRRGLFKRIVPNSAQNAEKRSYKKKFHHEGPRQKPSDAETIQRMLANLPAKRATRKIMSLKDGFPTRRKASSLPISNSNTKENTATRPSSNNTEDKAPMRKSKCNPVLRSSLRNVNKVISSKILDTNSSLMLRRRLRRTMRNAPKNTLTASDKTDTDTAIAKTAAHVENTDETDGSQQKQRSSLLDRVKMIGKRVARKKESQKIEETEISDNDKAEKRITRNAAVKVDTETISEFKAADKLGIKKTVKAVLGQKLIRSLSIRKKKVSTSETVALIDSTDEGKKISTDEIKETSNISDQPGGLNLPVVEEVKLPIEAVEEHVKKSPKKRRSNFGTIKRVVKKMRLQKSDSSEAPLPDVDTLDASSVANPVVAADNFLGTIDLIPTVQAASEDSAAAAPSLVESDEVSRSDESASVAISELVVEPPHPIAACPEELPENEVVDLSIQHTNEIVVQNKSADAQQPAQPKMNNTPLSKRCKRNRGLNDCIAMLTSKLLHVSDDENQTANTSTNNVSSEPTEIISKVITNICKPIKFRDHERIYNKPAPDVYEPDLHHSDAVNNANSEIFRPNILNIPPVLYSKTKSEDLHRITLPSTIVPIIKIPHYPLKIFGVSEPDRNIFRNCDFRNIHLNVPHDLNIFPVGLTNTSCTLVAQDLTVPVIRVPNHSSAETIACKPIDPLVEVSIKLVDIPPEPTREPIPLETANTSEQKPNKPVSELLNMSTYEMKTIIPSTETIISTAEPELLAGNPLPEEVIQKSQMLPIEAAKCDIEENKKDNIMEDLKKIRENAVALKIPKRMKPKEVKIGAARSRSKRKENAANEVELNQAFVVEKLNDKITETKKPTRPIKIGQSRSRSKGFNNQPKPDILSPQNNAAEFTTLPEKNIFKDKSLEEEVVTANVAVVQSSAPKSSLDDVITAVINAHCDSDDELPLSELVKTTVNPCDVLSNNEAILNENLKVAENKITEPEVKEVVLKESDANVPTKIVKKATKKTPVRRSRSLKKKNLEEQPQTELTLSVMDTPNHMIAEAHDFTDKIEEIAVELPADDTIMDKNEITKDIETDGALLDKENIVEESEPVASKVDTIVEIAAKEVVDSSLQSVDIKLYENKIISETVSIREIENVPLETPPKPAVKKTAKRKKKKRKAGKQKAPSSVLTELNLINETDVPSQIEQPIHEAVQTDKNNDINRSLLDEKEVLDNVANDMAVPEESSKVNEILNILPEVPITRTNRSKTRRKRSIPEDELPLSHFKTVIDVQQVAETKVDENSLKETVPADLKEVKKSVDEKTEKELTPDVESSMVTPSTEVVPDIDKVNMEAVTVAEPSVITPSIDAVQKEKDEAIMELAVTEVNNPSSVVTIQKAVSRKKRRRKARVNSRRRPAATKAPPCDFTENDNAVSETIESINETNEEPDLLKTIPESANTGSDSGILSELFEGIKPADSKENDERDEVDGPSIFTDSSIKTCSIIEATIESAFRLNDLKSLDDTIKMPSESEILIPTQEKLLLPLISVHDDRLEQNQLIHPLIKSRKSSKRPDRKKRRKKGVKVRRIPKLKAMKAYIDSVSEDTTSKGMDSPDEHSMSDLNLECLLRTNTPSLTTEESSINPIITEEFHLEENKSVSPIPVDIPNELPGICRSDQSTPIEEFATDCNNSFDGLIRSHEPFDVARDLSATDEPIIPPLKLSATGILDAAVTFDSLAGNDISAITAVETDTSKITSTATGGKKNGRKPRKRSRKATKRTKLATKLSSKESNAVNRNMVDTLDDDNVDDNEPGNVATIEDMPLNNDEILTPEQLAELSIESFLKPQEKCFDIPDITVTDITDIDPAPAIDVRKFDSSIYDFDPTSEDQLLDEISVCKSPHKPKLLHVNKEVSAEETKSPQKSKLLHTKKELPPAEQIASLRSISPRRSRSRKTRAATTATLSEVIVPVETPDSSITCVSTITTPDVLKELHVDNDVHISPRRSQSRKSEVVIVEIEKISIEAQEKLSPKLDESMVSVTTSELNQSVLESTSELNGSVLASSEVNTAIVTIPEVNTSTHTTLELTTSTKPISELNTPVIAKPKSRLKARQGRMKGKSRKKTAIHDPNVEEKEYLCDICTKSFARPENLMKHKRTLTHIAKLSEIEAREAQIKADKEKTLKPVEIDTSGDKDELESIHLESVCLEEEEDPDLECSKLADDSDLANNSEPIDSFNESAVPSYTMPSKLADIISDVLSKPVDLNGFEQPNHNSQLKRYKSLGERKSFDSENVTYANNKFPNHLNEEVMPPNIQTTDSILKTQISILENMIENKSNFYMNEDSCKSTDSKQSNGRCPSDMSIVSDIKQDDSNIISFSQHSNMNIIEPRLTESFLKPSSHYEEISEDSTVVRKHFEDQKARKALNRDEELFLECCSLLKSSSEVSNFSKQSTRKTVPSRPINEHEWIKTNQFYESNSNFHESNARSNTTDFYSDASRANTPIGDSFIGDMSNSDTLRNDWQCENSKFKKTDSFEDISLGSMNDNTNDNILTKDDSIMNKDDDSNMSKNSFSDDFDLDSGSLKNENSNSKIEEFAMSLKNSITTTNKNKNTKKKLPSETSQTSFTDFVVPIVKDTEEAVNETNTLDRKVITKGARKVFEGLKVSIPTNELNMKEVLSCSPAITINNVDSPVNKKKLSKIGKKLGLKVTKKKIKPKKKEEVELKQTINLPLHNTDKIHDVYDFEETQDNTDLFNSNLNKFRSQASEKNDSNDDVIGEISDTDDIPDIPVTPTLDTPSVSNFSEPESTKSTKQTKKSAIIDPTTNNNNKKKCMIMGRIFKNAFKSKIDLEISDIPCVDNNSLVENYVMNCTNTTEIESRFDKAEDEKKKMSQEEMDALFDKLLHESDTTKKFTKEESPSDCSKMKPPPIKKSSSKTDKTKNGARKRQRQNSSASDDEYIIAKTQRKKPTKKKVQDNSINLEQELKECMGVAGRKSQRKCTSGKQNVLVEYWSSDDSNFEALINPDFVRKKRDKTEKLSKTPVAMEDKPLPAQITTTTQPTPIDPAFLAEVHRDVQAIVKTKNKKNGVKRKPLKSDTNGVASKVSRRKRSIGDTLYYWSSSSDDESRDLIEVKPAREELDEDDEDRPMQHGWIVGDSPKKLVTMLAQAKGKKIDTGVCVKEQPKKRTSL